MGAQRNQTRAAATAARQQQGKPPAEAPTEEPGAAQRLSDAEAKVKELEAELAAARTAAVAEGAPAEAGSALSDVLAKLSGAIDGLAASGPAAGQQSFKPGESPQDVFKSLEGTVSEGAVLEDGEIVEHSGKKIAPVTFKSRGSNQVVICKARHRLVDARGGVQVTPGVSYQFTPDEGGKGGVFTTDDKVVADYLRSREGFNREYVEVGNEPDRMPSPAPVIDRVMDAQIELDIDALDEIEHEENATWARPAVLEAVAAARRRVERSKAEVQL